MRRSIPHEVPFEPGPLPVGDDGCIEWHPEGENVPAWYLMLVLVGVAILVGLAVMAGAALGGYGANSGPHPGTPGGPAAPSPHGPPPTAKWGVVS